MEPILAIPFRHESGTETIDMGELKWNPSLQGSWNHRNLSMVMKISE